MNEKNLIALMGEFSFMYEHQAQLSQQLGFLLIRVLGYYASQHACKSVNDSQ